MKISIPWLHELYKDSPPLYIWVVKNKIMRDNKNGIELIYKDREDSDIICGERTTHPGIPNFKGYSWRLDQSVEHEVVCTIIGNHSETPHVGVPSDCADMKCKCKKYGCQHLVIVGIKLGV